jgi:hypothetical protein
LDSEQIAALEAHLNLLDRWNRTINLTAIECRNEAVSKHIGKSLFLAWHLPAGALSVCDLGLGGISGCSGAIAYPVNLSKMAGRPVCGHAGLLAAVDSDSKKRTQAEQFDWQDVPIPWNPASFLSLGERFT